MRIAYFTDTREIGGAERNLADMALAAIDAGHVVTLLAPQEAVVAYLRERVPDASAIQLGSDRYHDAIGPVRRAAALSRQLAVLRADLRRLRPDLLHVNNGGFPGSDLCRIAPLTARLAGVPARVMSVHSVPWERDYLSHRAVQSVADSVVWGNVDAVVCPSQAVMDGLIDRREMPAELGRLLYYGVAEPAAEAGDRATLRRRLAPADELLVGMVSNRPVAEKGYDVFIEALALVPEIRGVLVGPHPGPEFVARIAQLGIEERLALEGPQKAVAPYYKAIDVLAVPSTAYECMPLVILEAMAAGRAAVGSQLSGIPEAIIDAQTGRTFPPGDVAALGAILRDAAVSSRGVWERQGEAGRRRWEDCFTLPRMGAALTALYAGLVAGDADSGVTLADGSSLADTSSSIDAEGAHRARSA
jgi:glycosyltransferase involved in cell wall biosynthesis